MNLKKIISEWGISIIGKKALHEDDVQKIIGEWGISIIGKKVLHEDDIHKFDDYPFIGQSHKCIGIDNGYLKIRFSGIVLRISPTSFYKTSPPHFLPFDRVKYISSKQHFMKKTDFPC